MKLMMGGEALKLSKKDVFLLLAIPLLVCTFVTVLMNIKPVYLVEAKIVYAESIFSALKGGSFKGLDRNVRRALRQGMRAKREDSVMGFNRKIETLRSRQYIEHFIDEHQLKPMIFPKRWDKKNAQWTVRTRKQGLLGKLFTLFREEETDRPTMPKEPSMAKAVKIFQKKIRIKKNIESGIITVRLKWKNAEQAAQLVNAFIEYGNVYIAQQEQEDMRAEISRLEAMLAQQKIPEMKKMLYENIQTLQSMLVTEDVRLTPAFDLLDAAWIPEKPIFKFPFVLIFAVFIISFIGTLVYVFSCLYKASLDRFTMENKHYHSAV